MTEAKFGVAKSVILFGQRKQGFGEQSRALDVYGNFTRFGFEHKAFYADNIAHVSLFERLIFVDAHIVAAEIALHFAVAVHNMTETRLAHNAF